MSRLSREERIARVTSIRDAAVPIIRSKGRWKPVRVRGEQKRVLGYRVGSLSMLLATPFQQFHMERPSIPARIKGDLGRYGAAVLMFQTKRPLGYELDVWGKGRKNAQSPLGRRRKYRDRLTQVRQLGGRNSPRC
jgi:hypothetical protein